MMKTHLIASLLISFCITSYSQIRFETGYFLDNQGQKTDCLIKNQDWKYNPTEFQYKLSEDSEIIKQDIATVQEFGTEGTSKYIRARVEIDKASEDYNRLSTLRKPEFQEEQLFLKVLLEGKADLYYYEEPELKRYFFKLESGEIEQLVYKKFLVDEFTVGVNEQYKQQLWQGLNCQNSSILELNDLDYERKDLVDFFINYYACLDGSFTDFDKRHGKGEIKLNLRPRVNVSSLKIANDGSGFDNTSFGFKVMPSLGLEVEFGLPFNGNKWAFIAEPTYTYFKSEVEKIYLETFTQTRTAIVEVDYRAIEVPIGIRHYVFFREGAKAFVNASLVLTRPFNSRLVADREDLLNLNISARTNLAVGLGFTYKNTYTVELRMRTNKDLLSSYFNWKTGFQSSSLILGYTLF